MGDAPDDRHVEVDERGPRGGGLARRALRIVAPLAVLVAGAVVVWLFAHTRPEPAREPPAPSIPAVEVVKAVPLEGRPSVDAHGTVTPAQQVQIAPQVSGDVVWVSPELVPGGRFLAGQPILRIDPRPYELAVDAQRGRIGEARLALTREQAERAVAERARALFPDDALSATPEGGRLARREPQLRAAREQLGAAESGLRRAELDLAHTTLQAPFDASVVSETVDTGQQVGPAQPIAVLVGTHAYHLDVSVPVDALPSIARATADGQSGSPAQVTIEVRGREHRWRGYVGPLVPRVTERGSMAQLVVVVPDPLDGDTTEPPVPLLLGSFVDVRILAEPIPGVVVVPREGLRDEDEVWIATDTGTLAIRQVDVVWRREDDVLVSSGVRPGERVIVSRLAAPVDGMQVDVVREEQPERRQPLQASLAPERGGPR